MCRGHGPGRRGRASSCPTAKPGPWTRRPRTRRPGPGRTPWTRALTHPFRVPDPTAGCTHQGLARPAFVDFLTTRTLQRCSKLPWWPVAGRPRPGATTRRVGTGRCARTLHRAGWAPPLGKCLSMPFRPVPARVAIEGSGPWVSDRGQQTQAGSADPGPATEGSRPRQGQRAQGQRPRAADSWRSGAADPGRVSGPRVSAPRVGDQGQRALVVGDRPRAAQLTQGQRSRVVGRASDRGQRTHGDRGQRTQAGSASDQGQRAADSGPATEGGGPGQASDRGQRTHGDRGQRTQAGSADPGSAEPGLATKGSGSSW